MPYFTLKKLRNVTATYNGYGYRIECDYDDDIYFMTLNSDRPQQPGLLYKEPAFASKHYSDRMISTSRPFGKALSKALFDHVVSNFMLQKARSAFNEAKKHQVAESIDVGRSKRHAANQMYDALILIRGVINGEIEFTQYVVDAVNSAIDTASSPYQKNDLQS